MKSDAWQDWELRPWKPGQLDKLDRAALERFYRTPFLLSARQAQRPPCGLDWRTWLFMGGRGAGKTRAGAEFIRFAMVYGGYQRAALVGPTLHDVREVMIEGPSGLLSISTGESTAPDYQPSRRRLVWPNGAEAFAFSAEEPNSLRGPQFDIAWCDEIAAWAKGEDTWNMLQMGLRLGDDPRAIATTTPRPVPLVKRLVDEAEVAITHSTTAENAANLAPGFVAAMVRHYGTSTLGQQELNGELIEDPDGAFWTRDDLDKSRINTAPDLDNIVVAIDPPASVGPKADTCGIVGVGIKKLETADLHGFVIADGSVQGLSPLNWAGRAVALAREVGAASIIAEANQGGEMLRHALMTAGCEIPVRLVHAKVSKRARAMPVAALYEAGRVFHVGVMRALEDQMCSFGADGFTGSPDRVDALVWAVWALMLDGKDNPRVRSL
ncbi:MAG: terminase family protein [Pseudomonadota bacterium]